jgi:hypothetical protein
MKLIGAGFGRTGTSSLKAALDLLGLGPCYHMSEVFVPREGIDHLELWTRLAHGRSPDVSADLQTLLTGYNACVDWPTTSFYRELMDLYPDAPVLLSVREPESWYKSCQETIYARQEGTNPRMLTFRAMVDALVWDNVFQGRFDDKAFALQVFQDWNEEVKRTVPPERLLVYEVKEGWEPLCRLMNLPVPEQTFPRLNDAATFNARREVLRKQGA